MSKSRSSATLRPLQRIAVIGAGPAGLTAAYRLSQAGHIVDVYEASDAVGGMSRTIEMWGQRVDLGPHRFFSSDRLVNELWLEVAGKDYRMVDRLTRIYYGGKFFHYPLQPVSALLTLGIVTGTHCALSYLAQLVRAKFAPPQGEPSTFEGWVVSRFGRRLFEIFFKAYSEKLWGIPCTELDSDFAAQRIKKLSMFEIVRNALKPQRGQHASLVDRFAYPDGGSGTIYEKMARAIERNGGQVKLGTPIQKIAVDGLRATGIVREDGGHERYDQVISTMPLDRMVLGLPNLTQPVRDAIAALKFRNTILVYLEVAGTQLFPDNWLYVHASDLQTGRITNFSNWGAGLNAGAQTSILCLEYWANFDEALWQTSDEALCEIARREIRATGLIGDAQVLNARVVRVPRSYPIYRVGYKQHLAVVIQHLKQFQGLIPIGRYGSFKYNNQDHSILMALLAAENISNGTGHDLWSINTDYGSYQEQALITETGLAEKPEKSTEIKRAA